MLVISTPINLKPWTSLIFHLRVAKMKPGLQYSSEFSLSSSLAQLETSVNENLTYIKPRLDRFKVAFDAAFPAIDKVERTRGEVVIAGLMDGPLTLYALGMNGPAVIELHGVLERFALRETANHISTDEKKAKLVRDMVERKTLTDVAVILQEVGCWSDKDAEFCRKLSLLRNGAAHKNPKIVSKMANAGKEVSLLEIDETMQNIDCIPLILNTTQLILKLSKFEKQSRETKPSVVSQNKPGAFAP